MFKKFFNWLIQNIKDIFIESVCLISFSISYSIWQDDLLLFGIIVSGAALLISGIIYLVKHFKYYKKICSEEYKSKFKDIYSIYDSLLKDEKNLFYNLFRKHKIAKTTRDFPDPAWSSKFREITKLDLEDDDSNKIINCQLIADETGAYYLFSLRNGIRRYYTKRLIKKVIKYYNKNI